jgi:stage V sporulation protein B
MFTSTILRKTLVVFIISILSGLLGYIIRLVLARNLTLSDFGLFYSVMTIFVFLSYFIDMGIGFSLSRKIVEFNIKKKYSKINNLISSVFYVQILITVFITGILLLFLNFLSQNYFHTYANDMLIIGLFWMLFMPLISVYNSVFVGFKKPEYYALFEFLKSLFILLFIFVFLYLGYFRLSASLAHFFSMLLLCILFFFIVKNIFPKLSFLKFKFDKNSCVDVFKFGLKIGLSNFIWVIIVQLDIFVITYFMTVTDVGIYQIAITISYLLLYIVTSLTSVIYPFFNELYFKDKKEDLANLLRALYKYIAIFQIPFIVFFIIYSKELILLLFTSKYSGASSSLQVLVIFTIFCSITMVNNNLLMSMGKTSKVIKLLIFISLLNLLLNVLLVPSLGLIGAAYSTLFSFILLSILTTYELNKHMQVNLPLYSWFKLSIAILILYLELRYIVLFNIPNLFIKLAVIFSILAITYAVLLLILRIISFSELKYFYNVLYLRKNK